MWKPRIRFKLWQLMAITALLPILIWMGRLAVELAVIGSLTAVFALMVCVSVALLVDRH